MKEWIKDVPTKLDLQQVDLIQNPAAEFRQNMFVDYPNLPISWTADYKNFSLELKNTREEKIYKFYIVAENVFTNSISP